MAEPTDAKKPVQIRVKYDELSAVYAREAIVNSTKEEIYIDFSSGVITDPASGGSVMPIHSRVAMTIQGATRLVNALTQSLKNIEDTK